jgi:AraC family transcriptional regulator, transcriptional activator of pobA
MVAPRNVPIHPLTDYGPEMSAGQQFFVGRFEESITRRPNRLRFHRHTYYEVFWINGRGGFFADFREYLIVSVMQGTVGLQLDLLQLYMS